jgi:hypothetical protein
MEVVKIKSKKEIKDCYTEMKFIEVQAAALCIVIACKV